MPSGPGDDRVSDPRSGRPRDDVAGPQLVGLALGSALDRDRRRPELQGPGALEHDERLGLERVAVWRRAAARGVAADPVEARAFGACGLGQQLVAVLVEREIVERMREHSMRARGLEPPRSVGPNGT